MLCIGRKFFNSGGGKESVFLLNTSDGQVKVTILEAKVGLSGKASGVRIGIDAPLSIGIVRQELAETQAIKAG